MSEYNEYVTAINKIFDYLNKMHAGWNNQDNYNYIETINEYRQIVINHANTFKTPAQSQNNSLEALGNDR